MDSMMNFGQTLGMGVAGRENDRDGKSREVFLSDGNTVRVEARDPYGHWYVKWYKGAPPSSLDGSYTSAEQAIRAVQAYVGNETYNTKVVEEKVEKAPPLLYKKPRATI